jgi:hypothetical protein
MKVCNKCDIIIAKNKNKAKLRENEITVIKKACK